MFAIYMYVFIVHLKVCLFFKYIFFKFNNLIFVNIISKKKTCQNKKLNLRKCFYYKLRNKWFLHICRR